jgi:hypothetical protein
MKERRKRGGGRKEGRRKEGRKEGKKKKGEGTDRQWKEGRRDL